MNQKPIQYIQHEAAFYKDIFYVDERVLIPRPETELLIDLVLDFAKNNPVKKIIDVGTGSGAIAITLALELPDVEVTGTDISVESLEVARLNAEKLGVSKRVTFIPGDLLDASNESFNVITANLPYISRTRLDQLDPSVKFFEPMWALDGGEDGFEVYRRLIAQISKLKNKPKFCVFEIDDDQGEMAISEIEGSISNATDIQIHQDLSGLDRFVSFSLN